MDIRTTFEGGAAGISRCGLNKNGVPTISSTSTPRFTRVLPDITRYMNLRIHSCMHSIFVGSQIRLTRLMLWSFLVSTIEHGTLSKVINQEEMKMDIVWSDREFYCLEYIDEQR